MSEESEKTLKSCSSWQDMRKHPEIKNDWKNALKKIISTLEERICRLKLIDEPFTVRVIHFKLIKT